jgi:flagella basal body P-ring formation protein FlgA
VTRQPLPANHVLTAADLTLREGDLGSLPADVATDAEALLGYRAVSGVAAGAPLRSTLLRPPLAVQQGQPTRLVMNGPGFSVQSEGQALANASRGDRVRVKTRSGQVVSGIAHDGQQVVVAF